MASYRITMVGDDWHGSTTGGLAHAFRSLGHAVDLVPISDFLPRTSRSLASRVASRAFNPVGIRNFNSAIARRSQGFQPDILIVCKGSYVEPETLARIDSRVWKVNFFPDNSFRAHKFLDAAIFPLFDHIFTTKRFGIEDFARQLGIRNVSFLPHGFDPRVHRPFRDPRLLAPWECDVSFVGTWSPRKEQLLGQLRRALAPGQLRIWGGQWEKRTDPVLDDAIQGYGMWGDLYALAISASRINLGLLSERRTGASDDDQITSRTFHIPAAGGFMLHQRTDELLEYFEEGKEVACFSSGDELVDRVRYYLANTEERERIAAAGHARCVNENSQVHRARSILEKFEASRLSRNERGLSTAALLPG